LLACAGTSWWLGKPASSRDDPGMKRATTFALWVFSFWYLGSAIALLFGISDAVGPILGLAAGSIIALDPRRMIWTSSETRAE
jgi:hypothetical protein